MQTIRRNPRAVGLILTVLLVNLVWGIASYLPTFRGETPLLIALIIIIALVIGVLQGRADKKRGKK